MWENRVWTNPSLLMNCWKETQRFDLFTHSLAFLVSGRFSFSSEASLSFDFQTLNIQMNTPPDFLLSSHQKQYSSSTKTTLLDVQKLNYVTR